MSHQPHRPYARVETLCPTLKILAKKQFGRQYASLMDRTRTERIRGNSESVGEFSNGEDCAGF
eukprot:1394302-Amorphochlora_amoeboformis.AAC.2